MMLVRHIHKLQARKVKEHKDKTAYAVRTNSSELGSEL
jgi:arginine repressor